MYFPREEYEARWKRVRATMRARGHETLVIWQRSAGGFDRAGDVYWLTNYASSASGQEPSREGLAIGRGFAAVLFHRGRDPELHIAEAVRDIDVSELSPAARSSLTQSICRRVSQSGSGHWELKDQCHTWATIFCRRCSIGG